MLGGLSVTTGGVTGAGAGAGCATGSIGIGWGRSDETGVGFASGIGLTGGACGFTGTR